MKRTAALSEKTLCPLGLYLLRQIDRATHADITRNGRRRGGACAWLALSRSILR